MSPPFLTSFFLYLFEYLERSFFVLDTESDLVLFFKKANDTKPQEALSLGYGFMLENQGGLDSEQIIVDQTTGEQQPGFKFQFMSSNGKKKKGKPMLVIAENPSQFDALKEAFIKGSQANRE